MVLRGPSGSGKSTTARVLLEKSTHKIAYIEQDHYRFIFRPAGGGSKPNSDTIHRMIRNDVLITLNDGYDVILEGILSVEQYSKVLDDIIANHSGESYIYYFDISFEETVRRHTMRKTKDMLFTENDMKEWYSAAHRSDHFLETIIPENSSLEETIATIVTTSELNIS